MKYKDFSKLTFKEIKDNYDKEYETIPYFYAFSDEQFDEGLKELYNDFPELKNEKLFNYGNLITTEKGCEQLKEIFKVYKNNVRELFKNNPGEFKKRVRYELNNTEYFWSENDSEVLNNLYIDYQFIVDNDLVSIYENEIKEYEKAVEKLFF